MSNHRSPSTGLSALLTLALLAVTVAAADESPAALIRRVCGSTQAANPPPFDVNFVDTMEAISQNISGARFAAASSGTDPSDRVYGLGQCFGYLSQTDCGLCYAESRVKLPLCLPSNSARVYLSGCFLRYENYNFSQQAVDGSDSSVCGSPKGVKDRAKFRETAIGLIGNLTNGAYEDGDYYKEGNASSSSPSRVTVYGIAQCWRSLNKSGCRKCLESAQTRIVGCLPASDGKALNAGCFVRYSLEPFFVGSSSKSSSVKHRRRLAAGLGASFAAAVVIGAAFLWRKKRSSTGNANFTSTEGSSEIYKLIAESGLGFKYDELRNATDYFSLQNKLGQGGYGTVYKGVLPDGKDIAVKRLFFHTTQFVDQFFNEVNLISQVQHKNLVKLLGCSIEGPESLLVYEYLPNTSLDHFLFDSYRKIILDWERRLEILVGTAEGLAYLHEASEVRIIHRDIKASNVLLDEKFKPKIADFGLARYFAEDQSHLSTGIAGTIGYMAPEYVIHGQLTEKADVYSYGVLVHEVLTGRRNASSVPASSEGHSLVSKIWEHFSSSTLIEMLDPNLQGQCSEEQAVKVFHVGLLCTQASSTLRPTMRKVVEMMATKHKDLPPPTEPPFINLKGMELKFGFGSSETSLKCSSSSKPSSSKPPGSVNQMSFSIMQGR